MAYGDSLRGYGHSVHLGCNFMCAYCGYDGRPFPNWLQLTVDHIVPTSSGGTNDASNKVTACQTCNSITSRMVFPVGTTREQALAEKLARIRARQTEFFNFWREHVAPQYLAHWQEQSSADEADEAMQSIQMVEIT